MGETEEKLQGWFAGRIPDGWFEGPPEVSVDREEILVVGALPDVDAGADATDAVRAAARAGQIGPTVARIVRTADDAGYDSIWVMDHFFQIGGVGPVEEPMLEGYSALSFIAGHSARARLGTLVTGVTYRHPGILAKTVTTLD